MNKNEARKILASEVSEYLRTSKIKKFKAVKPKIVTRKPNSASLPMCPDCGSSLIVEISGLIVCSNDRLKEIYNKCLEYERADNKRKIEILKEDKSGNFMAMFERWAFKDITGNRNAFTCLFSNRLHNPTPSYTWTIRDVFQVKRLEKALKRKLTIAENEGSVKIKYKNKKGYWVEEAIILYKFPWGLL